MVVVGFWEVVGAVALGMVLSTVVMSVTVSLLNRLIRHRFLKAHTDQLNSDLMTYLAHRDREEES
jgi:hypothetical protein